MLSYHVRAFSHSLGRFETFPWLAARSPTCGLAQIAPADLDIPVLGQLAPAQLPLRDALEPGSLKVVRLDAALGDRPLRWNTRRGTRTPPRSSPISTPNSTACVATASAPATSRISWLNPTPQMITVYASPWSSPSPTQHSLPSGRHAGEHFKSRLLQPRNSEWPLCDFRSS
jgi:hypothetical protein